MDGPTYLDPNDPILQQLQPQQPAVTQAQPSSYSLPSSSKGPTYVDPNDPILQHLQAIPKPQAPPANPVEAAEREIEGTGGGTGPISMALQFLGDTKRIASGEQSPPGYPAQQSDTDTPGEKTVPVKPDMVAAAMSMRPSVAGNPFEGATPIKSGVQGAKDLGSTIADQMKMFSKPTNDVVNTMKAQAAQHYENAATQGGIIHPELTNQWLDKIQQHTAGKTISSAESPVTSYVADAQKLRNQPLYLKDIIDYDKELGDNISNNYANGHLNADGLKFMRMQDDLRNTIQSAPKELISGGDQGFQSWQDAMKSWQQGRKLDDITRIMDRAEYSQTPATSLQSGFRALLTNPGRTRGWSPEEISAAQKVATSGKMEDAVRDFGSRLGPVVGGPAAASAGYAAAGVPGAMVGYPTGWLASHAVTTGARNFAGNLKMNKAKALADLIQSQP